jgi:DeoR family transcriptional regulator of aga operon
MVIADGSKIGQAASAMVAPAQSIHTLVTDASAPAEQLDALRSLGMTVVVAVAGNRRRMEEDETAEA